MQVSIFDVARYDIHGSSDLSRNQSHLFALHIWTVGTFHDGGASLSASHMVNKKTEDWDTNPMKSHQKISVRGGTTLNNKQI